MTKFYVGQRVRLVHPAHEVNRGITGTIRDIFNERTGPSYNINCDVNWDIDLSGLFDTATHTSRLEPATDSYDLTTWDQCVWQPEHLRATA